MTERVRAPLPEEITADGLVILPALPQETPLARANRVRTHCAHGHAWLPRTTLVCFTPDARRVRRCLICLGKYTLPPQAQPEGAA